VSINGIDYDNVFCCWNDELQLLTKDGVVPTHATQLQAKMENASACFWETPLPLDVQPQRLVFPPRGASEAQNMPGARLLWGDFPIGTTTIFPLSSSPASPLPSRPARTPTMTSPCCSRLHASLSELSHAVLLVSVALQHLRV
jgi:hypothetical protein